MVAFNTLSNAHFSRTTVHYLKNKKSKNYLSGQLYFAVMILFNDFIYCLYKTLNKKYILKVKKNMDRIKNIKND